MADNFFDIKHGHSYTPQAGRPSNPLNGDMYYDSVRNTFSQYMNGGWTDIQKRTDVASAASLTSTNFTTSVMESSVIKLTGSTVTDVHGFTATPDAKQVIFYNGTNILASIKYQSGTEGTAANRIITPNGADLLLSPGQSITLMYESTQSRWLVISSPGSGTSGAFESLIQGNDSIFEQSIGNWALYANTINVGASFPDSGTGGTATGLTLARNSSTPINGLGSLRLSKDAANREGSGMSLTLAVPDKFKNKPVRLKFYVRGSVNFGFGSDDIVAPGDVGVYAYDATNSILIQPTFKYIDASGLKECIFDIQNTSSIRVVLHIQTSNALAWDLDIDDVTLQVNDSQFVANMTDWIDNPSAISAVTTAPTFGAGAFYVYKYRIVGDEMELFFSYAHSSAAGTANGSGTYLWPMPPGYTINSDWVHGGFFGDGTTGTVGFGTLRADANREVAPVMVYDQSNLFLSYDLVNFVGFPNYPVASFTNYGICFNAKVKVNGLTSGFISPQSIGHNFPAVMTVQHPGGSYGAGIAISGWSTPFKDSTGSFNPSTGEYTVKVPGDYDVRLNLLAGVGPNSSEIRVNTILVRAGQAGYAGNGELGVIAVVENLKTGDIITVDQQGPVNITGGQHCYLSINRVGAFGTQNAPQQVAMFKLLRPSGTPEPSPNTPSTWSTRTINTVHNAQIWASLSSNQIILQPGVYKIDARVSQATLAFNRIRWRNITDSSTAVLGMNSYDVPGSFAFDVTLKGCFTITAAKTFELQHWFSTANTNNGWGVFLNDGEQENYLDLEIIKIM